MAKRCEVVLEKEFAEEGGVLVLHGDEPRQHDGEVERARPATRTSAAEWTTPAQESECSNDDDGQERRHRTFGQRGHAGKEVDIEEPELGVGFVPGIPAEQADGEGRGHLHVGGGAARKADDAGAGHGDERRVEVAAGAESSHVQVDERHHDEGEAGRGQARAPVVHAEFLKDEHGAPVVERRLLKPGMAVEVGRDAGAEAVL